MNVSFTKTVHHESYAAISPRKPDNSAAGKSVAVSGGAGGIGFAICRAFCEAGADVVVILARRQDALDEAIRTLDADNSKAGRTASVWGYRTDITDAETTNAAFQKIRQRLNGGKDGEKDVDILVANAAVLAQGETTLDFDSETYRSAFETNVHGNLNLIKAYLAPEKPSIPLTNLRGDVKATVPLPFPNRKKTVIDVATTAWLYSIPGQAPYSASKLAFTRILRVLWAEVRQMEGTPIRIHSFNPGMVYTPGTSTIVGPDMKMFPWDDINLAAHFAVWLASPAAAFTGGRMLSANWDVDELISKKNKFEEDPDFCGIALKLE